MAMQAPPGEWGGSLLENLNERRASCEAEWGPIEIRIRANDSAALGSHHVALWCPDSGAYVMHAMAAGWKHIDGAIRFCLLEVIENGHQQILADEDWPCASEAAELIGYPEGPAV